jgi:hypothetical protein
MTNSNLKNKNEYFVAMSGFICAPPAEREDRMIIYNVEGCFNILTELPFPTGMFLHHLLGNTGI